MTDQPYFNLEGTAAGKDSSGKTFNAQYKSAACKVTDKIKKMMDEVGCTQSDLASIIGEGRESSNVQVFRLINNLNMPYPGTLVKICDAFNISVQELMMNEKKPVPLIKPISVLCDYFTLPVGSGTGMDAIQLEYQLKIAEQCIGDIKKEFPDEDIKYDASPIKLPISRIKEYMHEKQIKNLSCFTSKGLDSITRQRIERTILNEDDTGNKLGMRIEQYILISLVTGMPLDYFLVQNYADRLDLSYTADGETIIISDRGIKNVVSKLLNMSTNARSAAIARICFSIEEANAAPVKQKKPAE